MPRPGHACARWLLLAVVMLGVLTTWAVATARYGAPDEPGHVLRAASVARGEFVGHTVDGLVSGFRAVTVPAALTTGDPRCYRHDRRVPATCAVAEAGVSGVRSVASSAGTNPPWYYLAVGLPVRMLGDPSRVIWYRLVAAGWFALVATAALVRARSTSAVAVVLALAPATWFLGGVVNPNSLEIALAILAWVGVARLDPESSSTSAAAAWVAIPAALAIMVRPVAIVEVATMLVVIAMLHRGSARFDRRRWLALAGPPMAAVLASVAWSTWSAVSVRDDRAATTDGFGERLSTAARGTVDTLREMAGSMGWAEFSAPWATQVLWWFTVAASGIAAWRVGGTIRRAWLGVAASVLIVPILFETVLAGRVGYIWQGRYSIPTAVGLVLLAPLRWPRRLSALALAAAVIGEVAALWATLRRYAVGTEGSWWLRDERWHPAVPPFVLLAVNAALVTALVASAGAFGDVSAGAFGDLAPHDVEG